MLNYRKLFEDAVGFVSGVAAGGQSIMTMLAVTPKWINNAIGIVVFILSSTMAGFLGVGGKYLFMYVRKKVIKYYEKFH